MKSSARGKEREKEGRFRNSKEELQARFLVASWHSDTKGMLSLPVLRVGSLKGVHCCKASSDGSLATMVSLIKGSGYVQEHYVCIFVTVGVPGLVRDARGSSDNFQISFINFSLLYQFFLIFSTRVPLYLSNISDKIFKVSQAFLLFQYLGKILISSQVFLLFFLNSSNDIYGFCNIEHTSVKPDNRLLLNASFPSAFWLYLRLCQPTELCIIFLYYLFIYLSFFSNT